MKAGQLSYFNNPEWPRLSPRAFIVWSALLCRAIPVLGLVSISQDEIRRMTGIGGKDTVRRGLDELLDKGYVKVMDSGHAGHHPFLYSLVLRGRNELMSEVPQQEIVEGLMRMFSREFGGDDSK
jgi:hypothetical protein